MILFGLRDTAVMWTKFIQVGKAALFTVHCYICCNWRVSVCFLVRLEWRMQIFCCCVVMFEHSALLVQLLWAYILWQTAPTVHWSGRGCQLSWSHKPCPQQCPVLTMVWIPMLDFLVLELPSLAFQYLGIWRESHCFTFPSKMISSLINPLQLYQDLLCSAPVKLI